MMVRLKQSWFVWSLLLCLVLVNGLLAAPAVAHADHHAKHEAGTHSTGLCAWQCAAGQSIETSAAFLESTLHPIAIAAFLPFKEVPEPVSLTTSSRGPPVIHQ
jgi:hypothetical protein